MALTYPPPKQRHIASVLGWIFLAAAPFAFLVVIVRLRSGLSDSWLFVATTCSAGVVVTATGVALIRLHAWAVVAAALESLVASTAAFAHTVAVIRHPPGPPGTDGAAYELMGTFMWAVGLACLSATLIRPSVRRTLGTPRAGWYPDPWKAGRLRWWDGVSWTAWMVS